MTADGSVGVADGDCAPMDNDDDDALADCVLDGDGDNGGDVVWDTVLVSD